MVAEAWRVRETVGKYWPRKEGKGQIMKGQVHLAKEFMLEWDTF